MTRFTVILTMIVGLCIGLTRAAETSHASEFSEEFFARMARFLEGEEFAEILERERDKLVHSIAEVRRSGGNFGGDGLAIDDPVVVAYMAGYFQGWASCCDYKFYRGLHGKDLHKEDLLEAGSTRLARYRRGLRTGYAAAYSYSNDLEKSLINELEKGIPGS
ncbi:hypothetical protein [Haloferula sp. A504]|uniref:hypothetical protein n=1 Tax=Haloferula sp. A504 TaxID=3373601 RepID=UPI0031C84F17|nr:hypothetical protein [Verrucomicrobiaceae bacterium E54]